jgi:hypothetical protein
MKSVLGQIQETTHPEHFKVFLIDPNYAGKWWIWNPNNLNLLLGLDALGGGNLLENRNINQFPAEFILNIPDNSNMAPAGVVITDISDEVADEIADAVVDEQAERLDN